MGSGERTAPCSSGLAESEVNLPAVEVYCFQLHTDNAGISLGEWEVGVGVERGC